MKKLFLAGIPMVGAFIAASLVYFWAAPEADCRLLVYGFCFGMLFVQGVLSMIFWHCLGSQKAAPMAVSGMAFSLGNLTAGGMMLVLDAPIRMSAYFLVIYAVLYLVCVAYLSCFAAETQWHGRRLSAADVSADRHAFQRWTQSVKMTFRRRRSGETDAERHVRNSRQMRSNTESAPAQTQLGPPALPVGRRGGT